MDLMWCVLSTSSIRGISKALMHSGSASSRRSVSSIFNLRPLPLLAVNVEYSITSATFAAKWERVTTTERASAQSPLLVLCKLFEVTLTDPG
jgi:hypothetical protein